MCICIGWFVDVFFCLFRITFTIKQFIRRAHLLLLLLLLHFCPSIHWQKVSNSYEVEICHIRPYQNQFTVFLFHDPFLFHKAWAQKADKTRSGKGSMVLGTRVVLLEEPRHQNKTNLVTTGAYHHMHCLWLSFQIKNHRVKGCQRCTTSKSITCFTWCFQQNITSFNL